MDYTNLQTQGFLGTAEINGLPLYNKDGVWYLPGILADATYKGYFGRVVSSSTALPTEFKMGSQEANFMGILVNEAGVNQNEPAKNDYRLENEPITAIVKGAFWLKAWHLNVSPETAFLATPTKASLPVYSTTTGEIGFIAATSPVPADYVKLNAEILVIDTTVNGVLLWLENNSSSSVPSSTKQMSMFSVALTGATGFNAIATIVESTGAIAVTVPASTTVTALIASFIHNGASIVIGSTAQVSGVTTNNFTSPVAYVVTAADGTTKTYTVTVTVHS